MPVLKAAIRKRHDGYYPAHAKVMVDGVEAARFVVETPDFTHIPARLPYLTAGSHTIAIVGVGDSVATLGKVRVEKAGLLPLAFAKSRRLW